MYITLHYITLQYSTLHYNTIQYKTIQYNTVHTYIYIYINIYTWILNGYDSQRVINRSCIILICLNKETQYRPLTLTGTC